MTWTLVVFLIASSIVKLVTAPPNIVIVWLTRKYAMHQKLVTEEVKVTFDGKELQGEEKKDFTTFYNEGNFLERHSIFPGNEDAFLNPDTDVIPYVIQAKEGKKEVTMYVYKTEDHFDIVKVKNKKVISYSLLSKDLDKFSVGTPVAN